MKYIIAFEDIEKSNKFNKSFGFFLEARTHDLAVEVAIDRKNYEDYNICITEVK